MRRNITNCILDLMWLLISFIGFQIFPGWLHFGSYFRKHLRHFCRRSKWNWKLNYKREKSLRFNIFEHGRRLWLGKFCTSPVILLRKVQLTFNFILSCFVLQNIISLQSLLSWQIKRTDQGYLRIGKVGIASAEVTLELQASAFTLEMHLVLNLQG